MTEFQIEVTKLCKYVVFVGCTFYLLNIEFFFFFACLLVMFDLEVSIYVEIHPFGFTRLQSQSFCNYLLSPPKKITEIK